MSDQAPATGPSDLPLTPSAQTSAPYNIFFGPDGLRPFWGLLIYIAALAVPVILLNVAIHLSGHHPSKGQTSPADATISEWLSFGFVFFATWIMSRIEGRSVFDYGLARTPRRLPWLITGALWGVLFLSLLIGILWVTHHLSFDGILLRPLPAIGCGLLWAIGFIAVGFFEESLFRGYLQFNLTRCFSGVVRWVSRESRHADAIGFWIAAILIAFGFGFAHHANSGESPIGLVCAGLAGLMFAFTLWRTGSLWWAIGLHAAWDWSQSFLYGVADSGGVSADRLLSTHPTGPTLLSGGLTGPEGSIFVLPIMLLITIVAALTLPRRNASLLLWDNIETPLPAQVNSAHE